MKKKIVVLIYADKKVLERILDMLRHIEEHEEGAEFEYYFQPRE